MRSYRITSNYIAVVIFTGTMSFVVSSGLLEQPIHHAIQYLIGGN